VALPKAHRLRRRQDFQNVYQAGRRRSGQYLTVRVLRRQNHQQQPASTTQDRPLATQIGVSISQKVSKRAVIRNRIKRQIHGAFRQLLPRMAPGWRIVVVVRPVLPLKCDYAEFLRELEQLLTEAEVLHGN
jgi:ribonuclease P protein component